MDDQVARMFSWISRKMTRDLFLSPRMPTRIISEVLFVLMAASLIVTFCP